MAAKLHSNGVYMVLKAKRVHLRMDNTEHLETEAFDTREKATSWIIDQRIKGTSDEMVLVKVLGTWGNG